jgi:hypothetical protein
MGSCMRGCVIRCFPPAPQVAAFRAAFGPKLVVRDAPQR